MSKPFVPTEYIVNETGPDGKVIGQVNLTYYACTQEDANIVTAQIAPLYPVGGKVQYQGKKCTIVAPALVCQDLSLTGEFTYVYPPLPAVQEREWGLVLSLTFLE